MRKPFLSLVLFITVLQAFAQAPDLNYYSQFGFSAGYARGEVKSGPSLG
jgi:hypothetical protein